MSTKTRGSVEDWLDSLDPATDPASDAADLRRIGTALEDVETTERELAEAVAAARKAGRSWSVIGMVLGISKQAAQQRFGQRSSR
jgi:tRNA A37 N6-isopentenylltransferase MiaA